MYIIKDNNGKKKSYKGFKNAMKSFIQMTRCFTKITEETLEDIDKLIFGKCEIYYKK